MYTFWSTAIEIETFSQISIAWRYARGVSTDKSDANCKLAFKMSPQTSFIVGDPDGDHISNK